MRRALYVLYVYGGTSFGPIEMQMVFPSRPSSLERWKVLLHLGRYPQFCSHHHGSIGALADDKSSISLNNGCKDVFHLVKRGNAGIGYLDSIDTNKFQPKS